MSQHDQFFCDIPMQVLAGVALFFVGFFLAIWVMKETVIERNQIIQSLRAEAADLEQDNMVLRHFAKSCSGAVPQAEEEAL